MNNLESESDELLKSQQNLLEKIQHSNRLFRIHFNLLVVFLISSVLATILLIFSLSTSLPAEPLSPYSIIELIFLIIMVLIIGLQIRFHRSFVVKANHALDRIERTPSTLYYGLTSYVNTLSSIFNPSDKDKPLSQLLTAHLFLQFYLGFIIVFLFSSVADLANTDFLLEPVLAILLFVMVGTWLCIFFLLLKIKKNVQKWEENFIKLEKWAQDLEEDTSEGSSFRGENNE